MLYYHNMKDDDCIFCKISSNEVDVHKVYEDDTTIAFLDIEPIREGHLLVIPKDHYPYMQDVPDDVYSKMMLTVKMLQKKLGHVFKAPKTGIFVSGWDIPHTHVHVVPMFDSKDITSKPLLEKTAPKPTEEGFRNTTERIKQAL